MDAFDDDSLFKGLKLLAESAFPKHCKNCGRTFETAEAFLRETQQISQDRTGLKQSWDDNDVTIVEVYRNCPCGSTLMDFFSDRRDYSEAGLQRREKFEKLIVQLISYGLTRDIARAELIKVLRGQVSEVLDELKSKHRPK
ncbi:MAG: hypothetical protein ACXU8A_01100 [Burkholderiaceae bacterium]